jgi:hypothetical protein
MELSAFMFRNPLGQGIDTPSSATKPTRELIGMITRNGRCSVFPLAPGTALAGIGAVRTWMDSPIENSAAHWKNYQFSRTICSFEELGSTHLVEISEHSVSLATPETIPPTDDPNLASLFPQNGGLSGQFAFPMS